MNLKPIEEKEIIYADPDGYNKMREERRKREEGQKWYNQPDAFMFDDEKSYMKWKNSGVELSEFLEDDYSFPDDTERTPESGFEDTNLTAEQFFQLDYKYSQYLLYRYLQKIDLSLQSLQEVAKNGNQ